MTTNISGRYPNWLVISSDNIVTCGNCGWKLPIKDPRTLLLDRFPITCFECRSQLGAIIVNPHESK